MKTKTYLPSIVGVVVLGLAASASAQDTPAPATPAAADSQPAPAKRKLTYSAPKTAGTARQDGDGGSRGGTMVLPKIYVLAPKDAALTSQEAPALFWYQDGPSDAAFEMTLTAPKNPKPLLSLKSSAKMEAGIHSVSLARQKVTLDPNIAYQWSISLSGDTKNRSLDKIASASIQRNEPPADLAAKVEKASAADKAIIYADAGFWYDAIQSISTAIGEATKAKDDKAVAELKSLRASLLEQGSLKEAAAADRK